MVYIRQQAVHSIRSSDDLLPVELPAIRYLVASVGHISIVLCTISSMNRALRLPLRYHLVLVILQRLDIATLAFSIFGCIDVAKESSFELRIANEHTLEQHGRYRLEKGIWDTRSSEIISLSR